MSLSCANIMYCFYRFIESTKSSLRNSKICNGCGWKQVSFSIVIFFREIFLVPVNTIVAFLTEKLRRILLAVLADVTKSPTVILLGQHETWQTTLLYLPTPKKS